MDSCPQNLACRCLKYAPVDYVSKFDSLSHGRLLRNPIPEDSGWHHQPEDQDAGSPAYRDKVRHAPLEGGAGPSNHGSSLGAGHLVRGLFVSPYKLLVRSQGPDG
jgi:hypothetical protein